LCRPGEPGNVGAVCRAMKNMGLSRLSLVAPEPLDRATLLTRAVHADDVWRGARVFETLAEALAGHALAVGTTCRRGRKRKVSMRPRELVSWLAGRSGEAFAGSVALVFGNERAGLDADEINLCNAASHIPVSDGFPSLNLSHAVQVYAYEFFLAFGGPADVPEPPRVKGEWVPLERAAADALTLEITDTLEALGFYKYPGREEQTRFLRDLICRAGLTEKEGRYLKRVFEKAARLGSMTAHCP